MSPFLANAHSTNVAVTVAVIVVILVVLGALMFIGKGDK